MNPGPSLRLGANAFLRAVPIVSLGAVETGTSTRLGGAGEAVDE